MKKMTRTITFSALMTAFALAFLFIAAIFPTGQLGFAACASVFVAAAVIECGVGAGMSVFAAAVILSFLIVPNINISILFTGFFGYYPIVKCFAEKFGKILSMCIKLLVFNAALALAIIFLSELVFGISFFFGKWYLAVVLGNIVFVVFDYGFSKIIALYTQRFSHK